ncbi:uncharacterized protein UV8b_06951 [Ustilaginoidea virens]|uniref:PET127-like protein n=1 Tax=Ustilaginoidea virens TaxID=1159556 RepID=A0A8E5HWJ6_USTVR|nr:uncharacterized protein UV8b_06951 [Ustilaginoidea virens]QUC22710.1 hypothetical protein UV8b_06951 [Ustilaginoidea virens]
MPRASKKSKVSKKLKVSKKSKGPKGSKGSKGLKESAELTESKESKDSIGTELDVKTLKPKKLILQPVEEDESPKIAELCHDLDRVLFNPGVYHLQDPRSGVFNFDPSLALIMPVQEFDFDALQEYITSSKDSKLRDMCIKHKLKYCGSTSSMTSMLSHFHFLLSAWRQPNYENLSKALTPDSLNFSALIRGPAAAFAHFKDGVYAIDADKQYDTENVLSMLGKSMEKLLTLPNEDFEKYRRSKSHQLSEEEKNAGEAYHYTSMGDFLMRSQLDALDSRLPGSGVFDLKTRAVISVRMDVRGYEKGVGYEIRRRFGQWESFEREYYDMIRTAFLKYSLQVRMGRMDGIFVAYHNTQRIFGFQYISLSEMDNAIHGTLDTRLGDQEFKCSVALLNDLLDRATQRFPGRTLRLHVETRPTKVPLTYFFVEPVSEEEMRKIQEAGKPSAEQLEQEIQGLRREESEEETVAAAEAAETEQGEGLDAEESDEAGDDFSTSDTQSENAWREMMAKVDETVENESLGVGSVREALQEALERSGLLQDKTELEGETCLDELVSALTAHSSKAKEAREARVAKAEQGDLHEMPAAQPASNDTTLASLILKVTEGINDKNPNLRTFERKVADLAANSKKAESISTEQMTCQHETEDTADETDLLDAAADKMDALDSAPHEMDAFEATVREMDALEAVDHEEDAAEAAAHEEDSSETIAHEEDAAEATAHEEDAAEAAAHEDDSSETTAHEEDAAEATAQEDNASEVTALETDTSEATGHDTNTSDAPADKVQVDPEAMEEKVPELLGMYVSIRSQVNGAFVERPEGGGSHSNFDWAVEYTVKELSDEKAQTIYANMKKRRKKVLDIDPKTRSTEWYRMFHGQLPVSTKKGKEFRKKREQQELGAPVLVSYDKNPLPRADGSQRQSSLDAVRTSRTDEEKEETSR